MGPGRYRRQHLPGRHALARFGQGPSPGRRCSFRPGFSPFPPAGAPPGTPSPSHPGLEAGPRRASTVPMGVAAPGPTAMVRMGFRLEALYALAYLHCHDDKTALQAVAGALGAVRRDLAAGTYVAGLAGSAGLWRALADQLHAPGPAGGGDVHVDATRRARGVLRCEAIALYAGGCTDSHAAGLLGVSRPVVGRLRRAC